MTRSFWKAVRRVTGGFTTGTWIAAGWLGLLVLATVTAPALPFDTTKIDLSHRAELPSWRHLLGTTRRGTDMLALIIDGARRSLLVGVGATAIAVVIGATSGLIVAYRKGWLDRFATLAADTLIALPSLAVALVASLILGSSRVMLTLLIGVLLSPGVFRTVRAAARAQAGRDYVLAARSLGARTGRILVRELLPNTLIPLVAYGLIVIGIAILIEGALALLGVAGSPTSSSWGSLIAAGQGALSRSPHLDWRAAHRTAPSEARSFAI